MNKWQNNSPAIMGIVNVTPDSFSDGGRFAGAKDAIEYGVKLYDMGVDIIDIGGESTRPGADPVTVSEEIKRTVPVIEGIIAKRPNARVSIDTYRSETADAALKAGAIMVNDISGGTFDENMFGTAAVYEASMVVMHIQGTPRNMQMNPFYSDLTGEICAFLKRQAKLAAEAGIKDIIVDPGIGFGKTVKHNYSVLRNINEFRKLGWPLLIGLSRKSFIGKSLNIEVAERDTATAMLEMYSACMGAEIIRTHNCAQALQMKKMIEFLNNG